MTPCLRFVFVVLLSLVCACGYSEHLQVSSVPDLPSIVLATSEQIARQDVVPNSYIVAFRAPAERALRSYSSFKEEYQTHYLALMDHLGADARVTDLNYITSIDLRDPKDEVFQADFSAPRALRALWENGSQLQDDLSTAAAVLAEVHFASNDASVGALEDWDDAGVIWFAEPNYNNELFDNPVTPAMVESYKKAGVWWHEKIKLYDALNSIAANSKLTNLDAPVIAVLDSGLDIEHPAFKGRLWENPSPGQVGCPGDVNGCDTTRAQKGTLGVGAVFPVGTSSYGQSCDGLSKLLSDPCGHGTHVAGIIAGDRAAILEGGGVCPVCRIMPLKTIDSKTGKGPDSAILNAFTYLARFQRKGTGQGIVRVANSSFGKTSRNRAVALLVRALAKSPIEMLVIGAAGNEDSMWYTYPAAFSDAIAVASVGQDDGKSIFSNFGPWVDVAAPGGDASRGLPQITSSIPGGSTAKKQGTSMAAPVVTGVAGLVLAVDPTRSFAALRRSLIATADPRLYSPDVMGGVNYNFYYPKIQDEAVRRPLLGSGVIDAAAALSSEVKPTGVLSANLSRVTNSCSTVLAQHGDASYELLLFIGILMPFAAFFARRVRWLR